MMKVETVRDNLRLLDPAPASTITRSKLHRILTESCCIFSECMPTQRDIQRSNCNTDWCMTLVGWRTGSWRTLSTAEGKYSKNEQRIISFL